MAIAFVQSRSLQANASVSVALAYTSNVTAGSLLVIGGSNFGRTFDAGSCTDSRSQTYTRDVTEAVDTGFGNIVVGVYSTPNAAAGATTVTLTATGTTDDITIAIHEYSGMATSSPADQSSATGTGTSATHASGTTGTTTQADELVFLVDTHFGNAATVTAGSGYSLRESQTAVSDMPIATEDKIVASTGTQSGSFTWDNALYDCAIVTYKGASAAVGGGWVSMGSRMAPGQRGPFDRRGFLLQRQFDYTPSSVVAVTILQRKTLSPLGTHVGGRQGST
jgi:hypothetical protein